MDKQQLDALDLMRPKVVDEFQRASAKLYMPNVRDALMEFPALLAIAREHEQTRAEIEAVSKMTGKVIRCCEGGGPENILGTLAISVGNLVVEHEQTQRDLAAAREEVADLRDKLLRKCTYCGGKGTYESSCRFCDDSTYDHECQTEQRPCPSVECAELRALSPTPGAQR